MIWDFRNEEALTIAKNHNTDVQNFADIKNLPLIDSGTKKVSDFHSISFVVIDESNMKVFRDILKPHRAELAE